MDTLQPKPIQYIDFLSPDFNENPYTFYKLMRDYMPLYYHPITETYVLSRYEDIAQAFKNPAFTVKNYEFQSQPLHGRTIIEMEGAEHSHHRNVVAPALRGQELAHTIIPIIERVAAQVMEGFRDKQEIDFASEFSACFPIQVIAGILGLEDKDGDSFLKWYRSFVAFIGNLNQDQQIIEAAFLTKAEIEAHLIPIIQERRRNPQGDILSRLCTAEIDGYQMSDQEIRGFVSLLITAGAESTDKMFTLLMRNLLLHPEQLLAVRENRELIPLAFAETLRFSPPTQSIMRITSEEVEVSGGTIPANAKVLLWIGSAQRDERRFEDPDEFNIFRKDLNFSKAFTAGADHLAFGGGRHFCLGAMLAKAEVEIALNKIFDHLIDIRVAPNQEFCESGIFTRGISSLRIQYQYQ